MKTDLLRSAGVHGWLRVATIETVVSQTDVFTFSTCIHDITILDRLKINSAFVGYIGLFWQRDRFRWLRFGRLASRQRQTCDCARSKHVH